MYLRGGGGRRNRRESQSDGGVVNGLHSAFVFPRQRRGWRRKKSGWFLVSQNAGGVEEKRREESVMFGRGWSGGEEKKRVFSGFPKRCTARVFYVLLVTRSARGLARRVIGLDGPGCFGLVG